MSRLQRRLVTTLALNLYQNRADAKRRNRADEAAGRLDANDQLTQKDVSLKNRSTGGEFESKQP